VTFAAAALDYLGHAKRSQNTKIMVGRIVRQLGASITCDQVDQAVVDRAARVICRRGGSATRQRNVATPTKAILNHAARRRWCDAPKFERAPPSGKRTEWVTPAEAEMQIRKAPAYAKAMLAFLYCTGARVSEMVRLQWSDVDLQHARAVLRDTKSTPDRIVDHIVELPPRAVAVLASLPHRSGCVFRQRGGKPYRATDDSRGESYGGQIRGVWHTSLKKVGVERRITPHGSRHSWATWHYAVHRDPMKLRDDGGWSSISQVERYAKLAPQGLVPEILAFWGMTKIVQVADDRRAIA
jgi:integrase